jgi:hypothetical protein
VLAYRDVNLAPREQLAELERIGDRFDGTGPALMTEYQPYGVRHFLRDLDPEGASELRRRRVPVASGGVLDQGEWIDTDDLAPGALVPYRTLVLRRSPAQSRPPAAYRLAWRGDYYEVWQRSPSATPALARIRLGGEAQPVGRPRCDRVLALAREAVPGQTLVAARRPPPLVLALSRARYPRSWSTPGVPALPTPAGHGRIEALVTIGRPGSYGVWIAGGPAAPLGPLVLSRADAADATLVEVPPTDAVALCHRAWDWIELGSAS